MPARIHDRGRGPELVGTRITVFAVMDYYLAGDTPEQIAEDLRITPEQARVAIEYIEANREAVEATYREILARVARPLPPDIAEQAARRREEIRGLIRARVAEASTPDSPGRS